MYRRQTRDRSQGSKPIGRMPGFARGGRIGAAVASIAILFGSLFVTVSPAAAATAQVSITPASTTAQSNVPVEFTLSITCTAGPCTDTVVSFPSTTITGNGSNADFGAWVGESSCSGVTRTATGGIVTFTYGTIPSGTMQCTFQVRAPEYTTLGGAAVTITPTVDGSSFDSVTGDSVVLTLTAGHNDFLEYTAPATIISGGEFEYRMRFVCGENGDYTGDIGLSALHLAAQLPANFVYAGYETRNDFSAYGTVTAPAVGSSGGTFVYDDPTGASCGNPPLNVDNSIVITVSGTVTAAVGTEACSTATATFTYIDRTTADTSAPTTTPCPTVADLDTAVGKNSNSLALANSGQYTFSDNSTPPYTFPGDWDSSGGSVYFEVTARTDPAAVNAGVSYLIQDPLPCLDNYAGGIYTSPAPGDLCDNPAYVPARVVPFGFTPTAADEIVLHLTDGSTVNVPYASGQWTIPATSAPIAQVDISPFASEGQNVNTIRFRIIGHAADGAQPDSLLRNTASTTPHLTSTGNPIGVVQTASANILVADPASPSGTVLYPSLTSLYQGACVAQVQLNSPTRPQIANRVEIAEAPSQAIYFDYLAPEGATLTTSSTITFALNGVVNGETFSSGPLTATVVTDYNGTGRDLYRWAIPSGTVTVAGTYKLTASALLFDLGAGCAGTYENDMTLGYGASATSCVFNNYVSGYAQDPPMLPLDNTDLSTNASPIADNFCGYSAPLTVEAINPGFSVSKTVQGNLDAGPVSAGTAGSVSPDGGVATYTVTFENTGESNLTDPVLYDILPRVGDTPATTTAPRGSDFAVALASLGSLPSGIAVEYSTEANPCRSEVLPTNPGCVDDWSSAAPSPLSSTTALRFAYDGTVGVGDGFELSFTVTTPATTVGDVALNSIGITVLAGTELMAPAESAVVSLAAADASPTIVKSASVSTYDAPGDTIDFTYQVTNDTAVTLSNVSVTDAFTDADADSDAPAATCSALANPAGACSGATTTLLPGQIATFTATYTATQGDLDHGLITDLATASAQPPTGGALTSTSNSVTVTADQLPELALVKSAVPGTVDAAGDAVEFRFTVSNTGNVTLSAIDIVEQTFTGSATLPAITCPAGDLAPADDVVCTVTYNVTQPDVDAGSIDNTAIATAQLGATQVDSPSSTITVAVDQNPSLTLSKTVTPDTVGAAGQEVTYSFLVTNDGNVTIDSIAVSELAFTGTGAPPVAVCPATALAPSDDMICTATYSLTQVDIDAASVDNTASVTGDDPGGVEIPVPPTSSATVTVILAPALTLTKSADTTRVTKVGTVIGYDFLVLNNGNTTVHDLQIDEQSFSGTGALGTITCAETTLAPTEDTTCHADYTTTAADGDSDELTNTALATALYNVVGGETAPVSSAASTATVVMDVPQGGLANTGATAPFRAALLGLLAAGAGVMLMLLLRRRGRAA